MDYKIEELSPVTRKITITVEAEEVNAAIATAIALYKNRYEIKGFRRGKAPASVVEGKYRTQIYSEATTDLVNYQINEVLNNLGIMPLSRIDVDAGEQKELERDKDFVYTVSFEVAPEFELPSYEGLEVEVERAVVKDEEVRQVEERILDNAAVVAPIKEDRNPQDGDLVVVTFGAYKGDAIFQGIQAENFELTLGKQQALPEFEGMLKTLKTGDKGEVEITFPEDFINPAMAGETLVMKATLHSIKSRTIPELTDEVAKKAGGFDTVEKMREAIVSSYKQSREQLHKSVAQKKLLDSLLVQVTFDLPPSLVENRIDRLLEDLERRLDRQGKGLQALGKSMEELREAQRPQAEEAVKGEIFLLAVAKKENLEVTSEEIDRTLQQLAMQSRQDFMTVKQYYEENNLIFPLKDRLLADKAMEIIYGQAKKIEIEPVAAEEGDKSEKPKAAKKPRAKKSDEAPKE